jgi:LmbE family N-acetylglucosaminyl deacetylase
VHAPFVPPGRGDRVVVVSAHLDDGVLSLGAAMRAWARSGARVELLTVLACDPASDASAGGWDSRGGFATEGESARARRDEDAAACALLGVAPTWLPYGSVDFERHGDERTVVAAVAAVIADADLVLLPGFPLSHPDHEWLVKALVNDSRPPLPGHVAFYAEQPYTARSDARPALPAWLTERMRLASAFDGLPRHPRALVAKWRAVRCYRSQLPLLALRGVRRSAHVAWSRELVTARTPA